jgi:hypothetical protein
MIKKLCTKCGIERDLSRFSKTNRCQDGHNGVCMDCINKNSNHRYHKIRNGTHKKREITKVNDKYFEEIDTEHKAYWLGFLYADGYVRIKHNGGQLKLKLSIKDRCHIEAFKNDIKSEHRIEDSIEFFKKNDKKYASHYSVINIYNTKIINDLIKLGCVQNKTQKIRLPNLNNGFINHFIRGYFDGDGCIHKQKNLPNSFAISIVSNNDFIEDIIEYLKMGHIYKQKNYSTLYITKIDDVKKFKDFIYENSTIYLKRKKEKFDLIQNDYKRDYGLTIHNYRTYHFVNPNGNDIIVNNLRKFCNENNLKIGTMYNLISGQSKISKNGWKYNNINN